MARVRLEIEIDDPQELVDIGEALKSVLGEPDDEPEELGAAAAAAAPEPAPQRRGRRRNTTADATAAAVPPAGMSAPVIVAPSAPVAAPVVASPPAPTDPLAAAMGAQAAGAPSIEEISTEVQRSMLKFGNAAKAIELAQKHGAVGDLASMPLQNRRAFLTDLQAANAQ